MARKDLTADEHAKVATAFASKHAAPLLMDGLDNEPVTLIIDLALGDEAEIFALLAVLMEKNWLSGYVVLPKLDALGEPTDPVNDRYVSALSTATNIVAADSVHGMLSAKVISAFHFDEYPAFATLPDGSPAHHWSGVAVQGTVLPAMKKRPPPIAVPE